MLMEMGEVLKFDEMGEVLMGEVLKFHISQLSPCQTHIQLIFLQDLKVVGTFTLHLIVVCVILLCEYI